MGREWRVGGEGRRGLRLSSRCRARAVLEYAALAHLVTLGSDGAPEVTIIWVGLDGDEIVAAHMAERPKVRNMQRDPRVVVSLETDQLNERGLREYLVVYGTARIVEGGAPEVLQKPLGPAHDSLLVVPDRFYAEWCMGAVSSSAAADRRHPPFRLTRPTRA